MRPRVDSDPFDVGTVRRSPMDRSLAIGAKTLAGAGLGILGVLVGTVVAGALLETVLLPTLLLKVAAGVAGGGIGLAKAVGDERRSGHSRAVQERGRM